jgi:hypothetical protein
MSARSASVRQGSLGQDHREPAREVLVGRVRRGLDARGEFAHLHVRAAGPHVVIESRTSSRAEGKAPVARLTSLGRDAYGLSFYDPGAGWEPIVLVDLLDEIVDTMLGGLDPDSARSDAA